MSAMRHLKLLAFLMLAVVGAFLVAFSFQHWLMEFDFHRHATRQSVFVVRAGSTIEKVSCGVECANDWRADTWLEVRSGSGQRFHFVSESFTGSRQTAEDRSTYLKSLVGKQAEIFLNPSTPGFFSTERFPFPWRSLAGMLLVSILTFLPFALSLIEYFAAGYDGRQRA